ncbi:MAG: pirin family protein [Chitinophagales bacterium]|nr:pirin family protein [Chitinophagales bacterium]
MKLEIIRKEDQVDGQFNNGAILEKRPVIYQGEKTRPYSNLFYWAHAWSEKGSTIGLHPHQGFEILSFVLRGSIEHYDTKNRNWIPLKEGSVQIIRAGNGISHAEKLNPNSSIFQIWFDPDLSKTLRLPASYNDYLPESFKATQLSGETTTLFKGEGAPIEMMTEGVVIKQMKLMPGKHVIPVTADKVISVFVIAGNLVVEGEKLADGDFFKVQEAEFLRLSSIDSGWIFIIESPVTPSYQTYASMDL